jgi:membrane protein implicated in regulation of membrane protease activity
MNEENQHTIRGVTHSQSQYAQTSTDNWIDSGAILGGVCGALCLLVFLITLLPVYLWLMLGVSSAVGALWWWRTFRRMAWSLQRSWDEQPKDIPAQKAKRLFLGSGLLIGGVLVSVLGSLLFNSLHAWWLPLWSGPLSLVLTASGVAVIVQTVKPKIKREKKTQ